MKMCKLYKEKCSDDNSKSCWLRYLQKEFQKMSLAKYKPKKDQCKTYVAFLNKTPNNEAKKEHKTHLQKKNDAYKLKDKIKLEAKRDPELGAITFVLQKKTLYLQLKNF